MKVHELAKELGLRPKEVIDLMAESGCAPVRSHFAVLDEEQANAVRRCFIRRTLSGGVDAAPASERSAPAADVSSRTTPEVIVVRKNKNAEAPAEEKRRPRTTGPVSLPEQLFGASVQRKTK